MPVIWEEKLPENCNTYLCMCPDKVEGSNRLQVRSQHLEGTKIGRTTGHIINGGATFSSDPSNSKPEMDGSWLLIKATSEEDARRKLKQDIYCTGGAWDADRISIKAVAVSPSSK